jgi:DNA-binding NarL/FixJ family response regulator
VVDDRISREAAASRVASWTADEVDVLRAVARGLPASVVAEHRQSTLAQVGATLASIRGKASVTSTQAAVGLARDAGLLD